MLINAHFFTFWNTPECDIVPCKRLAHDSHVRAIGIMPRVTRVRGIA